MSEGLRYMEKLRDAFYPRSDKPIKTRLNPINGKPIEMLRMNSSALVSQLAKLGIGRAKTFSVCFGGVRCKTLKKSMNGMYLKA